MRDTQKLKFAVKLIEEVSESPDVTEFDDQLGRMAAELDELRGRYHQEHAIAQIEARAGDTC